MNEHRLKELMENHIRIVRNIVEVEHQNPCPVVLRYKKIHEQNKVSEGLDIIALANVINTEQGKCVIANWLKSLGKDINTIAIVMIFEAYVTMIDMKDLTDEEKEKLDRHQDIDRSRFERKEIVHLMGETENGVRITAMIERPEPHKLGEVKWHTERNATSFAGRFANFFEFRRPGYHG